MDRTGFVLVSNNNLPNSSSDSSDTEATKQASTTYKHGNIARMADFDIIAKMSSNGKMSKPLCKRRGEKTLTVKVIIRCNKEGKLIKITALPDTGATIDILKSSIAKEHKMEVIPNDGSLRLVDAEGKPLEVEGLTYIDIQRNDGTWFLFLKRRPRTMIPELYRPTNMTDAIKARHKAATKLGRSFPTPR